MRPSPILALSLALAAAPPVVADDCRYSDTRRETVDATGATLVKIEAEAGFLRVTGRSDSNQIAIDGTACASKESYLDDVRLRVSRHGDEVRIETRMPNDSFRWSGYARLDLAIDVPEGIALEIEDGSGEIDIRDVGGVDIRDGSGSIELSRIAGDVRLRDGSGEIDVRDVRGELVIVEDGSGGISLRDVTGNVEIREDGSGSIDIEKVGGSVLVGEDGSGSIYAEDVSGDFTVERDGSGGISVDEIGGRVRLPAD